VKRAALLGITAAFVAALAASRTAAAQELQTFTASRQIAGEHDMRVRVQYGAGRLTVGSAAKGVLYRMQLRYNEDKFTPVATYVPGSLRLSVESKGGGHLRLGKQDGGEMLVDLARTVPMALALDFGAGRANVDLGGLSLTGLQIHTGAAEARIDVSEPNPVTMERAELEVGAADFTARHLGNLNARRIEVNAGVGDLSLDLTGSWRDDGVVNVSMGLGSLELRLPQGVGVKLRQETFLTSVDTQGLVKRGGDYYSVDWDKSVRKITVDLKAAFGSVNVRWVP
jgi:hypothetical protein